MLAVAAGQGEAPADWVPIVLLGVIGILFAVGNLIISILIGPSRQGDVKSQTYESGMNPIGDARRKFNVRFYIVAMIFLVFDVEIVFFYPWASIFPQAAQFHPGTATMLFYEMIVFVAILLVAYFYAWGKGVFRWD